jgi:pimeloyl-ACP methyl ester carboxylesterase
LSRTPANLSPRTAGGPCLLGGASFGGFVALEVSRWLDARVCILISSVRRPDELPPPIRGLRHNLHPPKVLFAATRFLADLTLRAVGRILPPVEQAVCGFARDADPGFLHWACGAVLAWHRDFAPTTVPIRQIHGAADRVLPARYTRPDVLVPRAGHLVMLTHAQPVNDFIDESAGAPD